MEWRNSIENGGYYWQALEAAAKQYHIPLDKPVEEPAGRQLNLLLYGTNGEKVRMQLHATRDGRRRCGRRRSRA